MDGASGQTDPERQMKVGMPRLVQFRLRILCRAAFLLLAVATVYLALYVLQEEKQLSYKNYQHSFHKTKDQIAATLRHPAGQLALLNPRAKSASITPLSPVLLPYSAIDFDDRNKVQQAAEMSGCLVQYKDRGALCVAIGNNPWAGGFIYVVGNFASDSLVPHQPGDLDLNQAHRVRVAVSIRGETYRWLAPFETMSGGATARTAGVQGRLTGFANNPDEEFNARPLKDFRGWVWQSGHCVKRELDEIDSNCARNSFFSLRLPIAVLQEELFLNKRPVWPPADLDQIKVHIEVLAPGEGAPLLDSNSDSAAAPFSLSDLTPLLLPGETLRIRKRSKAPQPDLINLAGKTEQEDEAWWQLTRLIRMLPVDEYDVPLEATERVTTPSGSYDVILKGDVRSVSKTLSVVATRVSWVVGAMLMAIFFSWFVIEVGIIRRITVLTNRATSLSRTVKGAGGLENYDLSDLRGDDELGVLASCLHDLLRRVKEDVEREGIRAEQEKEMWHAVGHEIMSPLQSLMALHGSTDNQSSRYINRMQQAIRVLYGSASPSEAFQTTVLQVAAIDINAFLQNVASNAPLVGIADVHFAGPSGPIMVRADDYSLEDVITHVLRNAERYRKAGSIILITLTMTETAVSISIHNEGPSIPEDLIDKIFEYGVSDQQDAAANGNRGQGLFVAKTYMAKMGGTIVAQNVVGGVNFVLSLQRVTAESVGRGKPG
jgi:signal transduction histidine kinase